MEAPVRHLLTPPNAHIEHHWTARSVPLAAAQNLEKNTEEKSQCQYHVLMYVAVGTPWISPVAFGASGETPGDEEVGGEDEGDVEGDVDEGDTLEGDSADEPADIPPPHVELVVNLLQSCTYQ